MNANVFLANHSYKIMLRKVEYKILSKQMNKQIGIVGDLTLDVCVYGRG